MLFSGGRGTSNISQFLLDRLSAMRLTIAVNAYDDGLSTGRLRDFIPGMLGPSDIRKNVSVLSPAGNNSEYNLNWLLEHRFPADLPQDVIYKCLTSIAAIQPDDCPNEQIRLALYKLTYVKLVEMGSDIAAFMKYYAQQKHKGHDFDFADCSLGNIIFSGCYLRTGQNFNATCLHMCSLSDCRAEVINVTDGNNLVLTAIKEDRMYLPRESDIVGKQKNTARIKELFLLPSYLNQEQINDVEANTTLNEKISYLRNLEVFPKINPLLADRIADADMIIYGPGTQHSSLLPSYLTCDLTEQIMRNTQAIKAFVCNIAKDHDIEQESVQSILQKFIFYSSRKQSLPIQDHLSELITHAFVQQESEGDRYHLHFLQTKTASSAEQLKSILGLDEVFVRNWEGAPGKHHSDLVGRELLGLLESQPSLRTRHKGTLLLSIIIPALNEAATIENVLRQLLAEDISHLGVRKEIIVVDGGSSDATASISEQVGGVTTIRLPAHSSYGEVLQAGFAACNGSIVATFPADDEYSSDEISLVLSPVLGGDCEVCFGSRMMKCFNVDKVLKNIYDNNVWLYLSSKYGGLGLSCLSYIMQGQFLSDPLTQLRVFNYDFLRNLNLTNKDFGIIGEIIGKTNAMQKRIFEVPVTYRPRKASAGKKMNIRHGIAVLISLMSRHKIMRDEV